MRISKLWLTFIFIFEVTDYFNKSAKYVKWTVIENEPASSIQHQIHIFIIYNKSNFLTDFRLQEDSRSAACDKQTGN